MGKSRKHKFNDYDDDFELQNNRKKDRDQRERRRQKRMKNAIRTNDIYALQQYEDEDFF